MTLKDQAFFQILLVVVEIKNFSFLLLPLSFDPKESSKMDIIMLRMQIFFRSLWGAKTINVSTLSHPKINKTKLTFVRRLNI